jgi:hypothetical protein
MKPALDERTAPGPAPGAVPFHPEHLATPLLRDRDFWRAVLAAALATLRPWSR